MEQLQFLELFKIGGVHGKWKAPDTYKVKLRGRTVFKFEVKNGELFLNDIPPYDNRIGQCGNIDEDDFYDLVFAIDRQLYWIDGRATQTSATTTTWTEGRHYITLNFDTGFSFSVGDVYGQICLIQSYSPDHPPESLQEKNRRRVRFSTYARPVLRRLISQAIGGNPPIVDQSKLDYLGFDRAWLDNSGYKNCFYEIVDQLLTEQLSATSSPSEQPLAALPKREISHECPVCFNDIDRPFALSPCGHFPYCSQCADQLQTCPICRTPITNRLLLFDTA